MSLPSQRGSLLSELSLPVAFSYRPFTEWLQREVPVNKEEPCVTCQRVMTSSPWNDSRSHQPHTCFLPGASRPTREAALGQRMPRTAGDEDVVGTCTGDIEDGAAGPVHTQAARGADLLPGAA